MAYIKQTDLSRRLSRDRAIEILSFFGDFTVKQPIKKDSYYVEYVNETYSIQIIEGYYLKTPGEFAPTEEEAIVSAANKLMKANRIQKVVSGGQNEHYRWNGATFELV